MNKDDKGPQDFIPEYLQDIVPGLRTTLSNPWLRAILSAETTYSWKYHVRKGNKESDLRPLVALLRSDDHGKYEPLTEGDRELLADLLERYQLKRPPGGRAYPLHTPSGRERFLQYMAEHVERLLKSSFDGGDKLTLNEAIIKAFRGPTDSSSNFAFLDGYDFDEKLLSDKKFLKEKKLLTEETMIKNFIEGKRGSSRRGR